MEWDTSQQWRRQVERRLSEVVALARGRVHGEADRIADLIEQIDELRREIAKHDELADRLLRVEERQDKMAKWLRELHVNGKVEAS